MTLRSIQALLERQVDGFGVLWVSELGVTSCTVSLGIFSDAINGEASLDQETRIEKKERKRILLSIDGLFRIHIFRFHSQKRYISSRVPGFLETGQSL